MEDGRHSVAFPRRWWYPACRSSELGRRPLAVSLMDRPLVVFRDGSGAPVALLDRCPHRNYPLSLGRVTGAGTLECGYHGWRFDGSGQCVGVPGLLDAPAAAAAGTRRVPGHATEERDGVVWVWGEPGGRPTGAPFALPVIEGAGAGEVVFRHDLECTMHAAVENALDVPHTAFLHRGIFRGGEPRRITAVRRELDGGVEVRYLGEPVGMGRVRLGGEATFDHWDRFLLPSVAQVEYAVDGWFRIVNTILHLPLSPFRTRAWFVVRFWSRLPAAVVRPVVLARGRRILHQDAAVLAAQSARIRQLGGEQFTSTDLDLLGNAIWRLLRRAERAERAEGTEGEGGEGGDGGGGDGQPEDAAPLERTVTFDA